MKVIDCFPFYNELDILEIRLHELYDSVDYFVLVEASKTQSLLDKPFYFDENKERYSKFLDKIIHIKIEDCPKNSHLWEMENFQRNCILRGLSKVSELHSDDVVLISDLDEIPSSKSIKLIRESGLSYGSINMSFHAYYFNMVAKRPWIGTVFCKARLLENNTPQQFRKLKDSLALLDEGKILGWHLSWMGGCRRIWEKSHSCIEPFDKSKIPSYEEFEKQFFDLISRNKFIHIEDLSKNGESFCIDNDVNFPSLVINKSNIFVKYFFRGNNEQ